MAEKTTRAVEALAALGTTRLRALATRVGAADAKDAPALATNIIASLEGVDDLRHQGLSDEDVEIIGRALGMGDRSAWKPPMSVEEFERLPFYNKPSYDNDVWAELASNWSSGATERLPRMGGGIDLAKTFVHLGLGATAVVQEPFTGMDWYERYGERTAGDGLEGRLVSLYEFNESWDSWEMHPSGHELVVCVAGRMTLHQEQPDGSVRTTTLATGEAAINDPGIWHTADVDAPATALFITAGTGTQHRKR